MGSIRRWLFLGILTALLAACGTSEQRLADDEFSPNEPIVTMSATCANGAIIDEHASGTLSPQVLGKDVLWELYLPSGWENWSFGFFNGGRRLVVFHQGTIDPYLDPNPALPNLGYDLYNEVVCNLIASNIAVAWTSNTENGYDIEGAYLSTEPLIAAVKSVLKYDPSRYYQVGFSQGGVLGPMFAEQGPFIFDGALSICGPVDGMTSQLQYLGDVRVLFDYFLQDNYSSNSDVIPTLDRTAPAFSVPNDDATLTWDVSYATHADGTLDFSSAAYGSDAANLPPKIAQALRDRQAQSRDMAAVDQIELPSHTPDILAYSMMQPLYYAVRGVNQLMAKADGQAYVNQDPYSGSSVDAALNGTNGVIDYSGTTSTAALGYVSSWYDSTGFLQTKLVTLHTTEDPAVPYSHQTRFAGKVTTAGAQANLRQQFADRIGHCIFPQDELVGALDGMIRWAEFGTEPATGDVTTTIDDPPSVTMGEPAVTTTDSGSTVAVAATTTDDVGVIRVEFVLMDSSSAVVRATSDDDSLDGWSIEWTGVADGSYTVTATAFDTKEQSATASQAFSIGDSTPTNAAPTASFTYGCTDLECTFDGSGSSDSDGTISSYAWDFGDGGSGNGASVSHTFGAGDDYSVTLTVTDDAGATGNSTQLVSVNEPVTGGISLSALGYKIKGQHTVDLTWSGATSTDVDMYRDGSVVETTPNDGAYTDTTGSRGGGSYTYKVCEAGNASTCSDPVTVVF